MALPLLPLLLLGGAAIALTSRKAKAAPATYRERCDALVPDLTGREICKLESTWYKDTKPKLDSSLGDVWLLKNTQDTVAVLVESDSSELFVHRHRYTPYSLRNIYAYLQWMRGQEGLPFPDTLVYVSLSRGYNPVDAQEQLGIAKMTADMKSTGFFRIAEWDKVLISGSPRNREYEGRSVADLAAKVGKSPHEWIFDALLETETDIDIILFMMSEANREEELRHPAMMIGTDAAGHSTEGPLSKGWPHPRSYGTYPRVLGHYVRELGVISFEEAIWKMSGFPAQKLRWPDRGLVKKGYKADLVILDPATVADRATYEAPHQYPAGIEYVLVNGQVVIHGGVYTGARPGSVLGR